MNVDASDKMKENADGKMQIYGEKKNNMLHASYPKKIGSVEMRGRSMDGNTK